MARVLRIVTVEVGSPTGHVSLSVLNKRNEKEEKSYAIHGTKSSVFLSLFFLPTKFRARESEIQV
jgi:hypothetical protein